MKRPMLWCCAVLALTFCSFGFADVSIKLGSVFPGWEKQPSAGSLYRSAENLITGYARQVGHSCFLPELFYRSGSSSIMTALIFYEGYLPSGSRERVLLDDFDQRVSLITPRYGSDVMAVLTRVNNGVYLILC